jgi:hypothetical protein
MKPSMPLCYPTQVSCLIHGLHLPAIPRINELISVALSRYMLWQEALAQFSTTKNHWCKHNLVIFSMQVTDDSPAGVMALSKAGLRYALIAYFGIDKRT